MTNVKVLDNVLTCGHKFKHGLEWVVAGICSLGITSFLRLCCCKHILDEQMKPIRTTTLEVTRREPLPQQLSCFFVRKCIVNHRASESSHIMRANNSRNVGCNELAIMADLASGS